MPRPEAITVRTLLAELLDIGGWPGCRVHETLKLQHCCAREGKGDYNTYMEESYSYAELLEKFPSAKPSIGQQLDHIPGLKPRRHSTGAPSRTSGPPRAVGSASACRLGCVARSSPATPQCIRQP